MYARYRFVQYAAECHYRPFVYVYGVPDGVKPCHGKFDWHSVSCQVEFDWDNTLRKLKENIGKSQT